jgi:exopolysaccharide biosynthesis polyprenyl glycosylphosphotransferase
MAAPNAALQLRPDPVAGTTAPTPSLVPVADLPRDVTASLVRMRSAPWRLDSISSREAVSRRLLAFADSIAVVIVAFAILSRFGVWVGGLAAALSVPVVLVSFHVVGLYGGDQLRLGHTTLDEAPRLLQLTGLLTLGSAILIPSLRRSGFGGTEIAGLWAATFVAVMCARMAARRLIGRLLPAERCLVIGDMARAERLRDKLATSPARAEVVGCLPLPADAIEELSDPEVIRTVAEEVGAHRIILAGKAVDADSAELIRAAKAVGIHVSISPRMFDVVGSAASFDEVEGMTMLGVSRLVLPSSSRQLKRALDLIASAVALLLIGPLLAALALAIRIDSKGPVFFRQTRVGRDGAWFSILKFRSMVPDADSRKDALRALNGSHGGLFKLNDDPRITRVGGFLRKTSLDELPQLFNVLRGEMSLVGPRPLVIDEDSQIMGLDRGRLHLTPGMTGPWQLLRSRVPLQEMVEIDYMYVANWSLWHDLKIMLRTAGYVARRGNV